jgi:hypothetical protein
LAAVPPLVTVFGRSGSFGGFGGALPGGRRASVVGVPGWGFAPGEAAFAATVAPDGSVVIANGPQYDDQAFPTAPSMVASVFSPASRAFANIVVPTTTGRMTAAEPGSLVGGADISGLQVEAGSGRIAFVSAVPYHGWSVPLLGQYPSLGFLVWSDGGWRFDAASSRTADGIASTDPTVSACPVAARLHDCAGFVGIAQLPVSGDLVAIEYYGARIVVLDPSGRLLASVAYPAVRDGRGAPLSVHPRQVVSDPTSWSGDERFAIVFDVFGADGGARPFALQELRYDAALRKVSAVSKPIVPGTTVGGSTAGFETVSYDFEGNLWAPESVSDTLTGGPTAVYLGAWGNGSALSARCGAQLSLAADWGTACPPDYETAATSPLGLVRSINDDPASGVVVATLSGYLQVLHLSGGSITAPPAIDLGLGRLVDRRTHRIGPAQGSVDERLGVLWLPIEQLASGAPCPPRTCRPAQLDQWVYRVDLSQLRADVGSSTRGTTH